MTATLLALVVSCFAATPASADTTPRTRSLSEALAVPAARGVVLLAGAGYERGGSPVVRDVQRLLAKARYSPGPVDGRYGPRTEAAVSRYQASHGLPEDGIVGSRTLADLRSHIGGQHGPAARPRGATAPAAGRPTRPAHGATARTATPPATPAPTAPARANLRRGGRPATGSPFTWIWLIGLLIAGLSGGVLLYARRRGSSRFVPQQDAGPGPPVLPQGDKFDNNISDWQETRLGQHDPVRHQPTIAANGAVGNEFDDPAMPRQRSDEDPNGNEMLGDISAAPIDTSAWFNLGVLPEAKQDLAGAEAAYRRADQRGHATAAANLGVLLEGQGDRMGAEAAYRRADERGEASGAFNLGVLLEENEDLAGAEAAYRRADQRGHAAAAANLGVLLEGHGDRIGAEAAYRRAEERGEANGAFNLGVLLEENEDLAGAESAYRRAEQSGDEKVAQLAHAAVLDLIPGLANSGPARIGGGRHGE